MERGLIVLKYDNNGSTIMFLAMIATAPPNSQE